MRSVFTMLLVALVCKPVILMADDAAVRGVSMFTRAYRDWDEKAFGEASTLLREACASLPDNATNHYWLGVCEFHRMLQIQGREPGAAAVQATMDAAIGALTSCIEKQPAMAEAHALMGTLYGMKIDGNLVRAIKFGPRISRHRSEALKHGADNPRVQYLLGVCQFHTSKKRAAWLETLESLRRANKLFETERMNPAASPLEPRWGQASCLAFMGRTLEQLGRPEDAVAEYRKAMALHPGHHAAQEGLERLKAAQGRQAAGK